MCAERERDANDSLSLSKDAAVLLQKWSTMKDEWCRKRKTRTQRDEHSCNWFFASFTFHLVRNNKRPTPCTLAREERKYFVHLLLFFFLWPFVLPLTLEACSFCVWDTANRNTFSFTINCYCVCACVSVCVDSDGWPDGWMRMWMRVQTSEWWEW